MRRIAFAGIVILAAAIAAALAIRSGEGRRDAQAATSVHFVWGAPPTKSFTVERWLGQRARYERWSSGDGSVEFASGINLDTGEWWAYQSERWAPHYREEPQSTLYLADPPIADQARAVVSKGMGGALAGEWAHLFACDDLSDRKQSVATATRSGRKVTVVTLIGGSGDTERRVLEFDFRTKHLLSMRWYYREKDGPEQLIATMTSIQYNRPAPAHLATPPKAARTAKATASVSIETGEQDWEGYEGRMAAVLFLRTAAGMELDYMIFPLEHLEHMMVPLELEPVAESKHLTSAPR